MTISVYIWRQSPKMFSVDSYLPVKIVKLLLETGASSINHLSRVRPVQISKEMLKLYRERESWWIENVDSLNAGGER